MNSQSSKLQIKLLSPAGHLLNCINCYAGQVSVFRSTIPSELQPYQRILAGVAGPEQLIVTLDDDNYRAEEQTLVGFGERFLSTDGTVSQFLISNNVPEDSVDSLLLNFGLENVFHTQCSLLSKCEERRLRLIAATYASTPVLVLNSPFDPITHEWREKFAELITSCARMRKKIVIVPYLSNRPECWIDNDCVARVQVGDNIQKTVGFKNKDEEIGSLVKQIRNVFGDQNALQELMSQSGGSEGSGAQAAPDTDSSKGGEQHAAGVRAALTAAAAHNRREKSQALPSDSPKEVSAISPALISTFSRFTSNPRVAYSLLLGAIVVTAGSLWLGSTGSEIPQPQATQVASNAADSQPAKQLSFPEEASLNLPSAELDSLPREKQDLPLHSLPSVPNASEEPSSVKVAMALDRYPERVRVAVLDTFEQRTMRSVPSQKEAQSSPEQAKSIPDANPISGNDAGEFLKLLEFAGSEDTVAGSSSDEVNSEPSIPTDIPPTNEDERREQIRQKFLEAIQRAQDRRGGNELPKFE